MEGWEISTRDERERRAARQRDRRMSRRTCGNCWAAADTMLAWGGQTIPICNSCKDLLDTDTEIAIKGYHWPSLANFGPWCSVAVTRPCPDCSVLEPGDRSNTVGIDPAVAAIRSEGGSKKRFIGRVFGRRSG